MTTLVVGASGATGRRLVELLLKSGQQVKVVVRPTSRFLKSAKGRERLTVIERNVSEITVDEMSKIVADCESVASCLGHNLTWKGIYGKPRRLVADSVRLLCTAIVKNAAERPTRLVLMNTAGNKNRDIAEPQSVGERLVIGLIRFFLPPQADNEQAADYLRKEVGMDNRYIEWVAVRPDSLINQEKVTPYSVHRSPTRSAIFNPGKTSRINVAHFMARLILDDGLWNVWKGQMPVVYNDEGQVP